MDKLQWFKFSYADWRMGKIQRCPEITQARFLNLCCLYWSKEANLSYNDAEIEIEKEHLDILINKRIIERDDEHIFIKFLDEQLEEIAETSKGKSKAAKARWDKYRERKASEKQNDADAMHMHTDAMQNDAEKRREEKRREQFDNFWNLYDKKVGDKAKIRKKWDKLSDETQEEILTYIPKYISSQPDKKYRKNPETFLNNSSWNDEIISSNESKTIHNAENF